MTIVDTLRNASEVLVICHVRPDCDSLGAGLTLRSVCLKLGVPCDVVCDSPMPDTYRFLNGADTINTHLKKKYALAVAVDCGDIYRTGKYKGYITDSPQSLNIDHHKTNDGFAKINIVREASSTCEILYDLLCDSGYLNKESAECLYCGLSTDTGNFMHSNTTYKVLETAAALVKAFGIDPNRLTNHLYRSKSYNRLRLTARAIESMRFFDDDSICLIVLTEEDLASVGCALADTEGLIDYAMDLKKTVVAVCMTEQGNQYKVSLRSKGFDVAAVAASFGGGGHTAASGCIIRGWKEEVVDKLVAAVRERK